MRNSLAGYLGLARNDVRAEMIARLAGILGGRANDQTRQAGLEAH
jgi:hypothetical protein